mgnify:CR=1 FL=1
MNSLQKTQWRSIRNVPKSTLKNEIFVDKQAKLLKHVPAPNHYKKELLDKGVTKTTNFIVDNTLRH